MISVTVCRGCCCGTARKHPETDHDGQLRQLAEVGVRVRVAECLDVCEHSNVMVVHPGFDLRRQGARVVWLGGMLDSRLVVHIGQWAAQGGPGAAAIPQALRPYIIARPAKSPSLSVPSGLGWPSPPPRPPVSGGPDRPRPAEAAMSANPVWPLPAGPA